MDRLPLAAALVPQPRRHLGNSKRVCVYCWGILDRQFRVIHLQLYIAYCTPLSTRCCWQAPGGVVANRSLIGRRDDAG